MLLNMSLALFQELESQGGIRNDPDLKGLLVISGRENYSTRQTTPVIPASGEAQAVGSQVWSQPGKPSDCPKIKSQTQVGDQ